MTTPDPAGNYPEPSGGGTGADDAEAGTSRPPDAAADDEAGRIPPTDAGLRPQAEPDPEANVGTVTADDSGPAARIDAGSARQADATSTPPGEGGHGVAEGGDRSPWAGPTATAGGSASPVGDSKAAPGPWTGAGSGPAGPPRPITDHGVEWSAPTWSGAGNTPPPPWAPDALHPQPGVPYQSRPGSGNGTRAAVLVGVAAAAVLLLCCIGAVTAALLWGREVADQVRDRDRDAVGMNQPGRDGDLEFLVTKVTCGLDRLGDGVVEQPASGQFCLVDVVVSNVGDRPVAFSDMIQRAYGPTDRRYAADSAAGLIANREQQIFLNEINPGNEVTAVLVYDIPADDRIVRLVLHESETSRGVEVNTA